MARSMSLFLSTIRPSTISTLFPYTTLFRSKMLRKIRGDSGCGAFARPDRNRYFTGFIGRVVPLGGAVRRFGAALQDRKSTRLNSSHGYISYAVVCLTSSSAVYGDCPALPHT